MERLEKGSLVGIGTGAVLTGAGLATTGIPVGLPIILLSGTIGTGVYGEKWGSELKKTYKRLRKVI